jgi:hypothetical protein
MSKIKSAILTEIQEAFTWASRRTALQSLLDGMHAGVKAQALVHIAADVADGETITLGSHVYEFKASGSASAGRIKVDVSAGLTPATATDALIVAINANETDWTAIDLGANDVLIAATAVGVTAVALAETMAGSNNVVSAVSNATYGGSGGGNRKIVWGERVPTAAEVTAGMLLIPLDFAPGAVLVHVRVTSTGAAKAWDGVATKDTTNNFVKLDNAGSTDWAATDTVQYIILE